MSEWVWLSSDVGQHPQGWVRFGRRDALQESGYGVEADVRELVETANAAEVLREFWEAWWAVEVDVNDFKDFNLHADTVERLDRAETAVREMLGQPAALTKAAT